MTPPSVPASPGIFLYAIRKPATGSRIGNARGGRPGAIDQEAFAGGAEAGTVTLPGLRAMPSAASKRHAATTEGRWVRCAARNRVVVMKVTAFRRPPMLRY